jgi:hypothetical protein
VKLLAVVFFDTGGRYNPKTQIRKLIALVFRREILERVLKYKKS